MNVAEEAVSVEGEEKGKGGGARDGAAAAAVVSLETLRKRMADFATERDWGQFHSPRNLLLALVCRLLHFSSLVSSLTCDISVSNFGESLLLAILLIWGFVGVLRFCCAHIFIYFSDGIRVQFLASCPEKKRMIGCRKALSSPPDPIVVRPVTFCSHSFSTPTTTTTLRGLARICAAVVFPVGLVKISHDAWGFARGERRGKDRSRKGKALWNRSELCITRM